MNIDPHTATLMLHGLKLSAGTLLKDLRASRASDLQHPIIANGKFETYRIVDNEAASHLVFKNGQLWQVSTSLLLPEDKNGSLTENTERMRHALHEAELQRVIGTTSLHCSNGCTLKLCFDVRSMESSIIITFPE